MVPILVILIFVIAATVYAMIQKSKQRSLMASLGMTAPALPDYQFTPGHLWLDRLDSGLYRIGLDELIPQFMGAPDRIHLVENGELVKSGETLAIFTKGCNDIFLRAPSDMRISKANRSLIKAPDRINHDPYRRGWLYHVSLESNHFTPESLLTGQQAKIWMNEEIQRLKEFVARHLQTANVIPNTAHDGGLLIEGLIGQFDQTTISEFEQQFLRLPPRKSYSGKDRVS